MIAKFIHQLHCTSLTSTILSRRNACLQDQQRGENNNESTVNSNHLRNSLLCVSGESERSVRTGGSICKLNLSSLRISSASWGSVCETAPPPTWTASGFDESWHRQGFAKTCPASSPSFPSLASSARIGLFCTSCFRISKFWRPIIARILTGTLGEKGVQQPGEGSP